MQVSKGLEFPVVALELMENKPAKSEDAQVFCVDATRTKQSDGRR